MIKKEGERARTLWHSYLGWTGTYAFYLYILLGFGEFTASRIQYVIFISQESLQLQCLGLLVVVGINLLGLPSKSGRKKQEAQETEQVSLCRQCPVLAFPFSNPRGQYLKREWPKVAAGTVGKRHHSDEKAANSSEAPWSVHSLKFFACLFFRLYLKLTPDI